MTRGAGYDLEAGLRRLHLPTVRRLHSTLQEQAEKEDWTYREFLEQLVSEEIAHRDETRITRAVRAARFPYVKTIEDFNFGFQQSVKRAALGRFLGPELVTEGRCLILCGRPGRGKTHLAIAIAHKAIQNGFDARFETAATLLTSLNKASRDGSIESAIKIVVEPKVLVIDELGYLAYGQDAANSLFQIVNQRCLKRKPIIITTNKQPKEWGKVLHDTDLGEAIVDRLMERGEVITLLGRSYRDPKDDGTTTEAK